MAIQDSKVHNWHITRRKPPFLPSSFKRSSSSILKLEANPVNDWRFRVLRSSFWTTPRAHTREAYICPSVRRWGSCSTTQPIVSRIKASGLQASRLNAQHLYPDDQLVWWPLPSLLRLILAPSRRLRNRVDIQNDISALGLVLRILTLEQLSRMLSEHAQFKGQGTWVCYLYLSPNDFIDVSIQKSQF